MKVSYFTGGLLGYIGVSIVQSLIIIFTLGIATPAAVCYGERWKAKHTYIDGVQLEFDGNGWELFGQYIKWFLLSIVTLGIYALWIPIKMQKWIVSHTHTVQ